MQVRFVSVVLAFFFCWLAATGEEQKRSVELRPVPVGGEAGESAFDPSQSVALFVGISEFTHDPKIERVRYAVDDAVDMAYTLSLERGTPFVQPDRVALALSGEPQKPASRQRLQALREAGVTISPAGQTDILSLLEEQVKKVGKQGMLIIGIATHGFSEDGQHYLVASNSLLRHRESAILTNKVFDIAATSQAPRSLIFLDTCRRRRTSSGKRSPEREGDTRSPAPMLDALARASGHVVFYAAPRGQYAYDDDERRNGVFTAAVLDGLRCSAKADADGIITVDALADYVDKQVLSWVRKHGDRSDRNVTQGIDTTIAPSSKTMPVAACKATAIRSSARGEAQKPLDLVPEYVQRSVKTFSALNAAGAWLWSGSVKGEVVQGEVEDLDGDGSREVVIGVGGKGEDVGRILVLDARGTLRWSADTVAPFNYAGPRSGRMTIRAFAVGDLYRTGTRQIVTLSLDWQGWFQSRLCIFDRDGALLASYWHPGHLHHVIIAAASPTDEPRIIVSGVNNDLRNRLRLGNHVNTVFVLDPKAVAGEAPPYLGKSARGTQLWYGILRPSNQTVERLEIVDFNQDGSNEISVWASSQNVFYISFDGTVLSTGRGAATKENAKFQLLAR